MPATVATLTGQLRAVGVEAGGILLVHASLRALGPVEGGAAAVVEALQAVVGPSGTLLVPTHTNQLSEPRHWRNPPAPADLWSSLRATIDAFDAATTPGWSMGSISEAVRRHPQARRSDHPHFSFAALGPQAEELLRDHPLDDGLGDGSPLGRLYAADGAILLLGVGHGVNTSFHLAENRAPWSGKQVRRTGAPVMTGGQRRWITFNELDVGGEDFAALGEDFAKLGLERTGPVAKSQARWMRQRAAVDFAGPWLTEHRV